jgi:FkbM family methyltransferase
MNWRYHGLEVNESSEEAISFLHIAKGCRALVDIGAQTGFMSALFARSRTEAAEILSVEPDPQVLPILRRARVLNGRENIKWDIAPVAVSDQVGRIKLAVSNHLYESFDDVGQDYMPTVDSLSLHELIRRHPIDPDIFKIDIESFEYEAITGSIELFERKKSMLQLEVHWRMLESRNRSPWDFLNPLYEIGYRGITRRYRNIECWRKASGSEEVSRLSLRPT